MKGNDVLSFEECAAFSSALKYNVLKRQYIILE